MNAHDPFKATQPVKPAQTTRHSRIHIDDLKVTNDPIPKKRSLGPGCYDELFASLQPGQCTKCEPEHTGAVGNAMRHWMKKQHKKNLAVKAMSHYQVFKERLGRVWLITKEQKQKPE